MPVRLSDWYGTSRRLAMMPSSVEPTRLSQPLASASRVVAGDSRMRPSLGKYLLANVSSRAPRAQRQIRQRPPLGIGQEVEDDEHGRRFLGQPRDAARRRM